MEQTRGLVLVLDYACAVMADRGHKCLSPCHFIFACTSERAKALLPYVVLQNLKVLTAVCHESDEVAASLHKAKRAVKNPLPSKEMLSVLDEASKISRRFGSRVVGVEHVFLAAISNREVKKIPTIQKFGKKMKDELYRMLDIPTEEQEEDIRQIAAIMKDLSPSGRLVKIQIGYLVLFGSARMCACMFIAGRGSSSVDFDHFLWLMEHTKHLEKKKKGKRVVSQKMKREKRVEVIKPSLYMTAGEANELSLLSRLDPDHREQVRIRLKKKK